VETVSNNASTATICKTTAKVVEDLLLLREKEDIPVDAANLCCQQGS